MSQLAQYRSIDKIKVNHFLKCFQCHYYSKSMNPYTKNRKNDKNKSSQTKHFKHESKFKQKYIENYYMINSNTSSKNHSWKYDRFSIEVYDDSKSRKDTNMNKYSKYSKENPDNNLIKRKFDFDQNDTGSYSNLNNDNINIRNSEMLQSLKLKFWMEIRNNYLTFYENPLELDNDKEILLSKELTYIFEDIIPSQQRIHSVHRFHAQIEKLLKENIEGCNVLLFGSYSNGLALDSESDVDLVLQLSDNINNYDRNLTSKRQQIFYIQQIAKTLRKARYPNVEPVQNARIPIVKFLSKNFDIQADLSINNLFPIFNSALLEQYSMLDPRVRMLLVLVKLWSKCRDLGDASQGKLHSYAFYILVIHYCQSLQKPLIPIIQENSNVPPIKTKDHNERINSNRIINNGNSNDQSNRISKLLDYNGTSYECSFDILNNWKSENNDSIGKILFEFFKFYSEYDFDKRIISIRTTKPIFKVDTSQHFMKEFSSHEICIEDPFILERNVCSLRQENYEEFMKEIFRAYKLLAKGYKFEYICMNKRI